MKNSSVWRGLWVVFGLAAATAGAAAEGGSETNDAFTFKRGVNISHWLSQNYGERTYAAPWFGEADVAWIAAQGFDHLRLAVDVRSCLASDGTLDDAKLKPVRDAIGWAKARRLGVVFDAHFLPGADFNPVGGDKRVYTDPELIKTVAGVWRELARRFKDEGPWLRFEILNEPVADDNRQLNPFLHTMLAAVRETNPTRVVYYTSNRWGSFHTVRDLELPDDPNVALTLHTYEPMPFTHQRASWAGFKETMPPVTFPGVVPDLTGHTLPHYQDGAKPGEKLTVEQVKANFVEVDAWLKRQPRKVEVYVGEFGVYRAADADSQRRYVATIVGECESRDWGWAVWDYKGSFAVRRPDGSGTAILDGLGLKKR